MQRVTFIIPAAKRVAANTAALNFDPTGGQYTFGPACLRIKGGTVATHCWASGLISDFNIAPIQAMAPALSCTLGIDTDPFVLLAANNMEMVPTPI